MTRGVALGWWLTGATLVALGAAPVIPNAVAAEAPSARVEPAQAKLGDTVVLVVEHFGPNELVDVTLCGGNAAGGSTYCLVQRGFQLATDSDGVARGEVFVDRPPVDCPCVVRVVAIASGTEALAPIDIVGLSPQNPAPPLPMENPLELVVSAVEDRDSWTAFFGAGAQRLVKLAVRNKSDRAIVPIAITATAGPVDDPTTIVATPPPPAIGPGETVAIEIPVDFPAMARGPQAIEGRIITEDGDLPFRVETDVRWWTVWVVPAILAFEVLLVVMWRLLRRSGRDDDGDADVIGGPGPAGDGTGGDLDVDTAPPAVDEVPAPDEPPDDDEPDRESELVGVAMAWSPPEPPAARPLAVVPAPSARVPFSPWPEPKLARWPAPSR
jgi:hypothetical protein